MTKCDDWLSSMVGNKSKGNVDDWLDDIAEPDEQEEQYVELWEDFEANANPHYTHVDVAWVGDYDIYFNSSKRVFLATCLHCGRTFAGPEGKHNKTSSARHQVQTHVSRGCKDRIRSARVEYVDPPF